MTLKELLDTVLLSQRVTLVRLIDFGEGDQTLLDKVPHDKIPYSIIAEFLDAEVATVEAQVDENEQPFIYIEL